MYFDCECGLMGQWYANGVRIGLLLMNILYRTCIWVGQGHQYLKASPHYEAHIVLVQGLFNGGNALRGREARGRERREKNITSFKVTFSLFMKWRLLECVHSFIHSLLLTHSPTLTSSFARTQCSLQQHTPFLVLGAMTV